MKYISLLLALILWIGCGYIARGYWIGHFTDEYPEQNAEEGSGVCYAVGPVALFAELTQPGKHWMAHGYSCQQRWNAFNAKYMEYHIPLPVESFFESNGDCRVEKDKLKP